MTLTPEDMNCFLPEAEAHDLLVEAGQRSDQLYTWNDLYGDGQDWSYLNTYEYKVYQSYRRLGQPEDARRDIFGALAAHDTAVGFALRELLNHRKRAGNRGVVAIMGGHRLTRDDPTYEAVVYLARNLAESGFLVMSGGGPGAMEAAHLGALTYKFDENQVTACLARLKSQAGFPMVGNLGKLLHLGHPSKEVTGFLRLINAWLAPAIQLRAEIEAIAKEEHRELGESLSIPTWHYGHEPPTPFALKIAKFFQNSLREDKLLAHAQSGIIYVKGGAGTVQEVFQDAAQNYYTSFEYFSPMVFFSLDPQQWTTMSGADLVTRDYRPVRPLLEAVFANAPQDVRTNFERYVQYLTRPEAILELFERFEASLT